LKETDANLPKKYRPPDSRRRKGRKVASPHIFEQAAADGNAGDSAANEAVLTGPAAAPAPVIAERLSSAQPSRSTVTKHLSRDYGYVRGEIGRIALVAGFLIVSLIITAILRN
jgi:hypothetical protein